MKLVWLMIVIGCGNTATSEPPQRSQEELRREHAGRLDTIAMQRLFEPDVLQMWQDSLQSRITAEAWILVEDSSGMVISEKCARQRMYMASLTKMMTCLLALEHGHTNDSIVITRDDYVTRISRVKPDDGYLAGNLIREMMLESDNDAAYALARHVGGDTLTFCQMMNLKAASLCMNDTHFANPNGMPNNSNYSTAHDLLILSRYCMSDTTFAQIVSTASLEIPLLDGRHLSSLNTNVLLQQYKGCVGIKTGYTRQAGGCLAAAATRNGTTLYLILLKSRSCTSRFSEATILLNHGFRVMQACKEKCLSSNP